MKKALIAVVMMTGATAWAGEPAKRAERNVTVCIGQGQDEVTGRPTLPETQDFSGYVDAGVCDQTVWRRPTWTGTKVAERRNLYEARPSVKDRKDRPDRGCPPVPHGGVGVYPPHVPQFRERANSDSGEDQRILTNEL